MKKYGQADYMCDLVRLFLEYENKLTNQQKNDIESRCYDEINEKFPTAAEWELKI